LLPIGVELPTFGIDGGEGVRMRDAVDLAARDLQGRGTELTLVAAHGAAGVQNPHQDEGTDNEADVAAAPQDVKALAARGIRVVVGPVRSNVAVAEAAVLRTNGSVAISGTASSPSDPGTHVFKLAPSDRQLAAAARAWMDRHFGARVCIVDDGTARARIQSAAFAEIDPRALRVHLGTAGATTSAIARCLKLADGLYATALEAQPVFCSAATARRAGVVTLVQAMSLRRFDPASFAAAGKLWRAQPAPILRSLAARSVARRYERRAFVAADDDVLRFYAAVQIAAQVARAPSPAAALRSRIFATVAGPLRFTSRGEVRSPRITVISLD